MEEPVEFNMDGKIWTTEWPTEPGRYWFYGYSFGIKTTSGLPQVSCVKVIKTRRDQIVRLIDGKFMYEAEGHKGFFSKAEDIFVPPLSAFEAFGLTIRMIVNIVGPVSGKS